MARGDEKSDAGQSGAPQEHASEHDSDQQRATTWEKQTSEKLRGAEEWEDPKEYGDPICVCEPEPYWQEIAEQLERERHERESRRDP